MKKYNLISSSLAVPFDFTDEGKPTEYAYCTLGIYLAEKKPDILASYLKDDETYAYNFLGQCEELMKMVEVLRPLARHVYPGLFEGEIWEPHALVYRANDGLAPVELIQAALEAVGIDVELEDHRAIDEPTFRASRQARWEAAKRLASDETV